MDPFTLFVLVGAVGALWWLARPAQAATGSLTPTTPPYTVVPYTPPGTPLPYSGQQPGVLGPGSTISWAGTYQGHDIYEDQNGTQWIMDASGQWVVSPYPDPTESVDTGAGIAH